MQLEAIEREKHGDASAMGCSVAYFSNQFADLEGHGLARYSRELFTALRARPGLRVVPVSGWSSLPEGRLEDLKKDTGLRLTGLGRRGTSMLWTFLDAPPVETCLDAQVDVVHAVALGYPVATRRPLVVTIHDLGPLTHPEYFRNTRPWVMKRALDQAVRKAATIVCVSRSTADEVRDYVGSAVDGRLEVIHEGVSPEFFEPPPAGSLDRLSLPDEAPFILSAGKLSPRKNLIALLKAMALIAEEVPHNLVLVGGAGWDTDEFKAALADPRLRDRVRPAGFVSDTELRALYRAASVYVHPSLYEGFGLPLLEAMASGTPVIASNRSSLPEVAGDAAILSETTDPEALAHDILSVCRSQTMQESLRRKGLARASAFTWSSCAERMSAVYERASVRAPRGRP